MGGPAHHVGILGSMLEQAGYETLLVHGEVGLGEDSLEEAVRAKGVRMAPVPGLRPELRPHDDARALAALTRHIRRLHPDIVHTHTAKAGMLGRLAAVLSGEPRPTIVHTYHGHVLEGYFGPVRNATYRNLEHRLARVSDALIGVSTATVDDLVRLGVADRSKFRMIPIGLDLTSFAEPRTGAREAFRSEAGVGPEDVLLTYVGRIAPIKRVDVMLRAFARARALGAPVRLAIVGDGALRPQLERLAAGLGVSDSVRFVGYRADVTSVAAASDVAFLCSDNEGTPVSLIEAAAAGTPAIATAVGGVPDVVTPQTGLLAPPGAPEPLARAIVTLAGDVGARRRLGAAARRHVIDRFSSDRLVRDIAVLYGDLLAGRASVRTPASRQADGAFASSD